MGITTREFGPHAVGRKLTIAEMDENFNYLNGPPQQDFLPSADNVYSLGSAEFRWKEIIVGTGTIIMVDTETGVSAELSVENGVLLVNGVSLLGAAGITFIADDTVQTTAYDPTKLQILHNNLQLQDGNDNITVQLITDENGIGKILFGGSASTGIYMNNGLFIDDITYHGTDSGVKPLYYNSATGKVTYNSDIPAPVAQSFNPQFADGGTLAGVVATGSYTMIAPKICFFRVYVDFSTCTNFGTSQYQITLPFPSAQTMRQGGGTLHQPSTASLYHIAGITDISENTRTLKLTYSGSTTDLAWKYNTPVGATTTASHFDISGTYEIA